MWKESNCYQEFYVRSFHTYQLLLMGAEVTMTLHPGSFSVTLGKLLDLFRLSFLVFGGFFVLFFGFFVLF